MSQWKVRGRNWSNLREQVMKSISEPVKFKQAFKDAEELGTTFTWSGMWPPTRMSIWFYKLLASSPTSHPSTARYTQTASILSHARSLTSSWWGAGSSWEPRPGTSTAPPHPHFAIESLSCNSPLKLGNPEAPLISPMRHSCFCCLLPQKALPHYYSILVLDSLYCLS